MKWNEYVKDQWLSIVIYLVTLLATFLILCGTKVSLSLLSLVFFILLMVGYFIFFYQYFRRKKYFDQVFQRIYSLDQKYLIHELIDDSYSYEGRLFYEQLCEIDKATLDYLNRYRHTLIDFKEYLELWLHEIKIPMASLRLIIENNKDTLNDTMLDELHRIEQLEEQVLFYVRSESVEKDYVISECLLSDVVRDIVKENRRSFIYKKIALEMKHLDFVVKSDGKWLRFILNQLLNNAIKYSKEEQALIQIWAEKKQQYVQLMIKDNGIGILEKDLPRVFEKGFTGRNGRSRYNSTGLGLYLCNALAEQLHHGIKITSKENEYTLVTLTFPIGEYSDSIIN